MQYLSLVYDYVIRIHKSHFVFVDSLVTIDVNDNPMATLALWYAISGGTKIQDLARIESAVHSSKMSNGCIPLYM